MDASMFTDDELEAIARGDASSLSDATLSKLAGEQQPVNYDVTKSIENIPSSAKRYATNMFRAFAHPLETIKSFDQLAQSGMANMFGNEDPELLRPGQDFAAVINDRLGSVDAIKRTAMEDPVGLAADLASILSGAGIFSKTARAASGLIDPLSLASRAIRGAEQVGIKAFAPKAAEHFYQKGMQFKDPSVMHEALARDISTRSLPAIEAAKEIQGAKMGEAIAANNQAIPISEVMQGMDDVRNRVAQTIKGPREVRRFDRMVDDLYERLGGKSARTVDTGIVGPNGESLFRGVPERDNYISMSSLQPFKSSGWKEVVSNATPKQKRLMRTQGAKEAIGQATVNARRLLGENLGDAYNVPNNEFAALSRIQAELEPISGRIGKQNYAGAAAGRAALGGALGAQYGGPVSSLLGALTGASSSLLRSPEVPAAIGRGIYRRQSTPISRYVQSSSASPLDAVLIRLEEENLRKKKKRMK